MDKGAEATAMEMVQSSIKVKLAARGDGCLLAKGWVMEMKRSQVTKDRISTEDSQDNVLKKPKHILFVDSVEFQIKLVFAKIIIKLLFLRVMNFINKHNILSDKQHGFSSQRALFKCGLPYFINTNCKLDHNDKVMSTSVDR